MSGHISLTPHIRLTYCLLLSPHTTSSSQHHIFHPHPHTFHPHPHIFHPTLTTSTHTLTTSHLPPTSSQPHTFHPPHIFHPQPHIFHPHPHKLTSSTHILTTLHLKCHRYMTHRCVFLDSCEDLLHDNPDLRAVLLKTMLSEISGFCDPDNPYHQVCTLP